MARHRNKQAQRGPFGFTLIELLVVITILGILAAVVVFAVRGVGDKGQTAATQTDAQTLRTAEEAFCAKNGYYAADVPALVNARLLASSGSLNTIETNGVSGACGNGSLGPSGFNVVCTITSRNNCNGAIAAGAVIRGGSLVVAESFAMPPSNVAESTNGSNHAWWEAMYNGLLSLDGAGNPSPELATVVPTVANGGISADGKTYTLTLRNDVVWQDNTAANPQPFTSADVKFTFEKVLFQFHSRAKTMLSQLGYNAGTCIASGITTPTPTTVQFTFANPYPAFLKQLNVTEAAQNPAHLYPSVQPSGCPSQATMDTNTIGTGPFQLINGGGKNQPVTGDAVIVKNPQYWKVGLPYLNSVTMVPYTPDETARYNALLSGAVGYVSDTPNSFVADLQTRSNFSTAATESLGGGPNSLDELIFNLWAVNSSVPAIQAGTATPHPILSDLNVRKAIAESIDRTAYLAARFNVGSVAQGPISNQIFGHESDIPLPSFNTADANSLLDSAGWAGTRLPTLNGTPNVRTRTSDNTTPLTLRFLYGSAALTPQVNVIKANLATVGIDVVLNQNISTATAEWFTNRADDLYILNYAQGYDPQVGVPRQYLTSQISTAGTPNNSAGYRNAAVDTALTTAAITIDPVARYNLYHDFQTQVVHDLPYVWLIETPSVRGFTTKCTGFKVYTGLFAESASCSG